jgi:hypothetical protein
LASRGVASIPVKGEGVPWKFKTGLDFLKRACAMGNEYGCKEHAIYGGTGQLVDLPGPGGALGFTFGWSKDEAKTACTEGHGLWRTGAVGKDDRDTCNIRLDVLEHDGSIQLEFVESRLAGISAYYDLDPRAGAATKEFVRVGDLVAQLYGLPSQRVYEVLDECGTGTLGDCIREKKAEFSMFWAFKDRHFIMSTLSSLPEEPLFLLLQYESPEGAKTVEHHGL